MAARSWRRAAAIAAARPGPARAPGAGPASEPGPEAAAPAAASVYVHVSWCTHGAPLPLEWWGCCVGPRAVHVEVGPHGLCAQIGVSWGECAAVPHGTRARSGPTAASAAPTATSTRTWCRRWTRRPCVPAWCRRHTPCSSSASITSVFFGGGTPSLASPGTIAAVLEAVAGAARLPAGAEVTLEANPSSTTTQRLAGFKAAGINRLSIGVQSLDDAELRLLGREHTAAEAQAAVEAAQSLFPGRTSIDLIFGLPQQSLDAWTQRLEAALGLCDDHISLYQLTLERGTALAAEVLGGALPVPSQDLLADMYQAARTTLVAAGFRHYEVSNFARKGALSTHNLSYWRAEQYIGVGPGAHGRFVPRGEGGCSREARVQVLEPIAWMRAVQSRGHGTGKRVMLSPLEQLEEVLALGLRTDEGIPPERWGRFSPHLSLEAVFGALQQQGWMVLDGGGLRCTARGLAVLDSLLPDLLCQLQRAWAAAALGPTPGPGRKDPGAVTGCGSAAGP